MKVEFKTTSKDISNLKNDKYLKLLLIHTVLGGKLLVGKSGLF